MKTKPRVEWNGLPGYLASQRLPGTSLESDLKHLDLGFGAEAMREFLKEPVAAIEAKIREGQQPGKKAPQDLVFDLVLKMMMLAVCAERERVAEDQRLKESP